MSVPPSVPVSSPSPSLPPAARRPGSPVAGFGLDLLIAIGALLGLSLACSLAWGLWRGIEVGMEAARTGNGPPAAADMAALMGDPGALAQILIALIGTGGAALLLYFWRRRATPGERVQSRQAALRPSTWGWTVLVAAGVFAGSSLIGMIAKQLGIEPVPTNLPLMEQALAQYPAFLVAFAVFLAPAYEELLFRRVFFGRLWAADRPWLGMLLSSAAFALVHEIPGTSPNTLPAMLQLWLIYGGMGAAFAWLYRHTGTLWAAIGAHSINNAIALAALVFFGAQ
ncbi:CPBP family intramembrane glutamic endopeptidase [Stenotrophomonas sp. Iso1]|uniref:CPBP family intramembrane glutamic endopeptidase n=1 Tax=Stenotrophomonas sp. Iso1 TaxID=2977283 RepID=UPI0022B7884D|nr:CPBP family intramembrane glutamic endopeptidase [Stenotrophomonas sp. Iso1]